MTDAKVTTEMIECWRINYGLDKHTPDEAMRWWHSENNGLAPAGAVAALGLCLLEIERLRAALAQQAEPQEPVAWQYKNITTGKIVMLHERRSCWIGSIKEYEEIPLYAAPPTPATFAQGYAEGFNDACKPAPAAVPLTDEQIDKIWDGTFNVTEPKRQLNFRQIITRAIELAHGIGEKP